MGQTVTGQPLTFDNLVVAEIVVAEGAVRLLLQEGYGLQGDTGKGDHDREEGKSEGEPKCNQQLPHCDANDVAAVAAVRNNNDRCDEKKAARKVELH